MTDIKTCSMCKEEKPIKEFYKTKSGRITCYCKPCDNKKTKNGHLVRKYGITLEDRDRMLAEQHNVCKICSEKKSLMMVDHCHTTGKVRGILCLNCNTLIGHAKDDLSILNKAYLYLLYTKNNLTHKLNLENVKNV